MGAITKFVNLALGQEDTFGKVLAGSTGKGAKTIWKESAVGAASTKERLANFVYSADKEVLKFDKAMTLANDVFDKSTMKALRKSGKTNKDFYNKLINLFSDPKNVNEAKIADFLKSNNITEVKQSQNVFKKLWGTVTKKTPAAAKSADDVVKTASEKLGKVVASEADDVAKAALKSGKGLKGVFKSLKGKGGTIGVILTVAFEIPEIIKAFKNGDGMKQVGRSTVSVGGFAAGAAAGAAVGSIIPVAGTAVGAIVGGLCGIVGGMIGGAVAEKAGDAVFGKSIAEQKEEAAEKQQETIAQMQESAPVQQTPMSSPFQSPTAISQGQIPSLEEMLALANKTGQYNQSFNTMA